MAGWGTGKKGVHNLDSDMENLRGAVWKGNMAASLIGVVFCPFFWQGVSQIASFRAGSVVWFLSFHVEA